MSLASSASTGSPLGWAAFGNQVETATELILRGARMDDGELLCAALVGHVEVGRLLIAHGADPNELFTEAGGNALHAAATCGRKPRGPASSRYCPTRSSEDASPVSASDLGRCEKLLPPP